MKQIIDYIIEATMSILLVIAFVTAIAWLVQTGWTIGSYLLEVFQ